jgi:hypothetical protein
MGGDGTPANAIEQAKRPKSLKGRTWTPCLAVDWQFGDLDNRLVLSHLRTVSWPAIAQIRAELELESGLQNFYPEEKDGGLQPIKVRARCCHIVPHLKSRAPQRIIRAHPLKTGMSRRDHTILFAPVTQVSGVEPGSLLIDHLDEKTCFGLGIGPMPGVRCGSKTMESCLNSADGDLLIPLKSGLTVTIIEPLRYKELYCISFSGLSFWGPAKS